MTAKYWRICVEDGLCDSGIVATEEQIGRLTEWVADAHDMYGEATGAYLIPNPLKEENARLSHLLDVERRKKDCGPCGGTGRIISHGGTMTSNSQCWNCGGEGKA